MASRSISNDTPSTGTPVFAASRKRAEAAGMLEEFRRLERAIPVLVSGRPLPEVLSTLVEAAAAAAGAPMGSIFLLDPAEQDMYPGVVVRLPAAYVQACERFPLGVGACGRAAQTGAPCVVTDTSTDPLFASARETALQNGIRALFSVPIITADRRILGALANHFSRPHQPTAEDIERNQLYANLAAAAMEMARAMEETAARAAAEAEVRMREQFIAILGHDLRSPLGAISAGADYLLRERNLSAPDKRITARISACATRMARMIDQLIDTARYRLGRGMPVNRQPASLLRICRQVIEELEISHPECNIQVDAASDAAGVWEGVWDPDRLAQLVSNLVGNALEHGSQDRPIMLRLRDSGDELALEVSSQGPPISPALLPQIFEPFRGSRRSHTGRAGLGLGLYISREIVRAHGGRIEVRSSDTGTTFRVALPRTARAAG